MQSLARYVQRHHVALLALFIALGGTSYAAVKLPANSVGAKQIKANAVTSSEVKNGALRRADFASGQVPTGPAGPAGAAGPTGPKGDKGDKGDAGPSFVPSVTYRQAASALDSSAEKSVQVSCATDKVAVGGYYLMPMTALRPMVSVDLDMSPNPYTWLVQVRESTPYDFDWQLVVKVTCVG